MGIKHSKLSEIKKSMGKKSMRKKFVAHVLKENLIGHYVNTEEGHLTLLGVEIEESIQERFLREGLWILRDEY